MKKRNVLILIVLCLSISACSDEEETDNPVPDAGESGDVWSNDHSDASPNEHSDPESSVDFASIATGASHTCAIASDGGLWCWGSTRAHGLIYEVVQHPHPALVDIPRRVGDDLWQSVTAGVYHTCAIREDHTLWCWGRNANGQLGTHDDSSGLTEPEQVGDGLWREVIAEAIHTCGIQMDGTLWCWGDYDQGQPELDDETPRHWFPERVRGHLNWRTLSTSRLHSCGIRKDGTLWCWGRAIDGQLGQEEYSFEQNQSPQRVGRESDWKFVDVGRAHTCGIREDQTLWCWGANEEGQLGVGRGMYFGDEGPERVGEDSDWTSVTAGREHTCGIRNDGTLWCLGNSRMGQLGNGDDTRNRYYPKQIGTRSDWAQVVAAGRHACGIRDDQSLWCWGRNDVGQLGVGESSQLHSTPTRVGEASHWTSVSTNASLSATAFHTHALDENGQGWSFGSNDDGQLGDGTLWEKTPTAVVVP